MPSVSSHSSTSDPYLKGVLSAIKWATGSLTFGLPSNSSLYGTSYGSGEPYNNFEAFTALQQSAARAVLQMCSGVANIVFTEVIETSIVHGDLRYAESDAPSTAWAYYTSTSALGGDAWFNNSKKLLRQSAQRHLRLSRTGNDTLHGGIGSDVYSGMFSNSTIVQNANGSWSIVDLRGGSPDGSDTLWNVELLQFSDSLQTLGTQPPPPPPSDAKIAANRLNALSSSGPTSPQGKKEFQPERQEARRVNEKHSSRRKHRRV